MGAAGATGAEAEAARFASSQTNDAGATLSVLRDMADQLRAEGDPPALSQIRTSQRSYLRGNQRYPECLEVGVEIWEQMYDWHVHTGQALQITALGDGRHGMATILSTLVLHVGASPPYVGPGSATL
jgi:hypothetical protein